MKNKMRLKLIYRIINNEQSEGGQEDSLVEVTNLFSDSGTLPGKTLDSVYQKYRFHSGPALLFKTLEDMGQFAQETAQETGAEQVLVLSNVDFNIGLGNCHDARGVREIFNSYGRPIDNPDSSQKRGGIFNKFFN